MATATPKRWYPNLKGIANPKSPFEVQTAESVHQMMDYIYNVNDRIPAAAPPSQAAAPAQAANWWNQPYAADTLAANGAGTSIVLSWSGYKIAPTLYASRKTPYIHTPNGSVTASGLVASTLYWFYPAFDTRSGKIVFAVDLPHVVPNTVAHNNSSSVALMKASSGGYVPLSTNGIQVRTGAGSVSGLGGGLLHGFAG